MTIDSLFPASHSILSETVLDSFLVDRYSLHTAYQCRLLKSWINDTYLLSDGRQSYIFRVYTHAWRSKVEVAEELRFILSLKEAGLSVSYPLEDREGQLIQRFQAIEGERFGVLFSFAEGNKKLDLTLEDHQSIGGFMGQMHLVTESLVLDRVTYDRVQLLERPFEYIQTQLDVGSDSGQFLQRLKTYLNHQLEQIERSACRKGSVHLDLWSDNLHFESDGRITLFDFDFCGNGYLGMDIAYYSMMLYAMTPDMAAYHEKLNAFYDGYRQSTNFSVAEANHFPVWAASLYFFYLGVQCQRFSAVFATPAYVESFIGKRIRPWCEFHQLPI